MQTLQFVVALAALVGSATAFTPVRQGAFSRVVAAQGKIVNVVDVNDDYVGPDNEIVPLSDAEMAEAASLKSISPMQQTMKAPVAPECPPEFAARKDNTPADWDGLPAEAPDLDKLLGLMCDANLEVPASLLAKREALEARKGQGTGAPAVDEAISVTPADIAEFKKSPPAWFKSSFTDNELAGVEQLRELELKVFTQLNMMQEAQQAEVDKRIKEIEDEKVVFDEAAEIQSIQDRIDALDKSQIALASTLMGSS